MLSHDLFQQNVLLSKSQKAPTIVEVEELEGPSPLPVEWPSFVDGTVIKESSNANFDPPPAERLYKSWPAPNHTHASRSDSSTSSSTSNIRSSPDGKSTLNATYGRLPRTQAASMQLPSFQDVALQSACSMSSSQDERRNSITGCSDPLLDLAALRTIRSFTSSQFLGSTSLLTPPEEKAYFLPTSVSPSPTSPISSPPQTFGCPLAASPFSTLSSGPDNNPQGSSTAASTNDTSTQNTRAIHISLPQQDAIDQGHEGPDSWLRRAVNRAVSAVGETTGTSDYAQMVAQILPARAIRSASSAKPIFELVLEAIQRRIGNPHFSVNITHAVPRMIAMDDVPTSPPATPQSLHGGNDYFDVQTVFSLAGVVPLYHVPTSQPAAPQAGAITPIIARRSVDVCVVERYIPPVSATEIRDFFSNSGKSYLVDRLAELKLSGGTLLLIYPTRKGAETFVSHYLNPVLEPVMRRFIFFHNLFPYVGGTLGKMEAAASVPEFGELSSRIRGLCAALSSSPLERNGPRSTFNVVYSDVGELMLERSDWMGYWIHQEQPRLRADLMQYQQGGGRMPAPIGLHEANPPALARELGDALRKSNDPCGGAGVEVGVFVIQRST